jgi:hypothetical protein
MEGKQPPALAAVAFGENKHAAARFKPPRSFIDGFKGLPGMAAVDKEPAQDGDPHINEGNKKQFLFRDKTERPPYVGQGKDNVKNAPVIGHKADSPFFGDILPAFYGKGASCHEDNLPGPGLGDLVHKKRQGVFKSQKTQNKGKNTCGHINYQGKNGHKKNKNGFNHGKKSFAPAEG